MNLHKSRIQGECQRNVGAAALYYRREDRGDSGHPESQGIQKLQAQHHRAEKASLLGLEGSAGSSEKNDGDKRRLLRPPSEVHAGALQGDWPHRLRERRAPCWGHISRRGLWGGREPRFGRVGGMGSQKRPFSELNGEMATPRDHECEYFKEHQRRSPELCGVENCPGLTCRNLSHFNMSSRKGGHSIL